MQPRACLCHVFPGLVQALACAALGLLLTGCMYGAGARGNSAALTVFDNFHIIEPQQAYRCAQLNPQALQQVIRTYGIKTIVNLRGENDGDRWYDNEAVVAREMGVKLVDISWRAERLPPRSELLKLYDTFQTAELPVLIHCRSGADRSGAAAAIWRMQVHGDSRARAQRELSLRYGHLVTYRHMDELVRIFRSDRDWIIHQYPGPSVVGDPSAAANQLMTGSVLTEAHRPQ